MDLADVIQAAVSASRADLATALPGKVERYNVDTQTADVRPMLKRQVPTPDGDDIAEELPVIPSVPVLHPAGAGWFFHVPLQAGDTVLLLFQQADASEWERTGQLSEPVDQRPHHLAHAVCIPGYRPQTMNVAELSPSNVVLRRDGFITTWTASQMQVGGTADAVALASKVDAALQAIALAFSTFVAGSGGANFPQPYVYTADDSTVSQRLKVDS